MMKYQTTIAYKQFMLELLYLNGLVRNDYDDNTLARLPLKKNTVHGQPSELNLF